MWHPVAFVLFSSLATRLAHTQEKVIPQGCEHQEAGIIGSHVRGFLLQRVLKLCQLTLRGVLFSLSFLSLSLSCLSPHLGFYRSGSFAVIFSCPTSKPHPIVLWDIVEYSQVYRWFKSICDLRIMSIGLWQTPVYRPEPQEAESHRVFSRQKGPHPDTKSQVSLAVSSPLCVESPWSYSHPPHADSPLPGQIPARPCLLCCGELK